MVGRIVFTWLKGLVFTFRFVLDFIFRLVFYFITCMSMIYEVSLTRFLVERPDKVYSFQVGVLC